MLPIKGVEVVGEDIGLVEAIFVVAEEPLRPAFRGAEGVLPGRLWNFLPLGFATPHCLLLCFPSKPVRGVPRAMMPRRPNNKLPVVAVPRALATGWLTVRTAGWSVVRRGKGERGKTRLREKERKGERQDRGMGCEA